MAEQNGRATTGRAKDDNTATDVAASSIAGLGVLVGALGAAGLVLVLCTNSLAGVGLTMVNIAVPAVAFGYALLDTVPRGARRPRRIGAIVLALLIAAGATGVSWGVSGVAMRQFAPADYIGRYGERVQVAVMDADCRHGTIWRRGPRADFYCEGATWRAGGRDERGRLTLFYQEMEPRSQARQIDAYVLGNEGYSVERVGEVESWAWWAGRPLWLLLGLPVLAAGLLLRRDLVARRD
ncbi:hypothetical protein [Catellatospora citrea]|uniref:Uncharacterized protein n=1 Tax=Catellatospora citrea TaxID=53366 RepID=A0A8J3NXG4_9ACTN|nr:hypothetical protein [Catellatospora citrea]RKE12987.1 hypothetical protein C8E86_7932 [Catellatospora citrea]GIF95773.1 hypothetical protein Cci01nite_08670 [Catellatospora citrea]